MRELINRATRTERDRTVSYTWLGSRAANGDAPGVRLSISHDKTGKQLTATFYRFTHEQRDGYGMERHEIVFAGSGLPNSKRYAATKCQRYSANALAVFEAAVLEMLETDTDPCSRFVDEAATFVGVTA